MQDESGYIMISALQHYMFCPRQWGLLHLEQVWAENRLTMEGKLLHENAHTEKTTRQGDIIVARALRVCSHKLQLTGQADVVEFHPAQDAPVAGTVSLSGREGRWLVYPVEYKHGKPKSNRCDEVQLCAQAMCLEEMLGVEIIEGAFFYGQPRRRYSVCFDEPLRTITANLTDTILRLQAAAQTPTASYSKKCDNCSIVEQCCPKITGVKKKVEHYLHKAMENDCDTDA